MVKLAQTIWEQWRKKRKERFDQGDLDDIDGFEVANGVRPSSGLNNSSKFMDVVFTLFLVIWFALGNYWVSYAIRKSFQISSCSRNERALFDKVFTIWKPNFTQPKEHGSQNWCSRDAYMFAVFQIYTCYVLGIAFLLITLCVLIYSKCCRVTGISESGLAGHGG